jgi:hypothetical protein
VGLQRVAFGLAKDVPLYRQLTVQGLSLLLNANIDVGLKHCLSMAYHDDPHVRTVFIHVFSQVLGADEPREDASVKTGEAEDASNDMEVTSKAETEQEHEDKDEDREKVHEEKKKRFEIADRGAEGQIQPSRLCEVRFWFLHVRSGCVDIGGMASADGSRPECEFTVFAHVVYANWRDSDYDRDGNVQCMPCA